MKAEYDSQADAIAIELGAVDADRPPARGDRVHERGIVAVVGGEPVDIEVLYPDLGLDAPLEAAAAKYGLDVEALAAAARSALAAPDRPVTLDVGVRS